jgi:hypothetical protein
MIGPTVVTGTVPFAEPKPEVHLTPVQIAAKLAAEDKALTEAAVKKAAK